MFAEEQASQKIRLTGLQKEVNRLERENDLLHDDLKTTERRATAAEKAKDDLAHVHEKLQRRHAEVTSQADAAVARVDALELERADLDSVRNELTAATAELAASSAARLGVETGLVIAEKQTATLRLQATRLEEERDLALVSAKRLAAEVETARMALKEMQARVDVQAGELAAMGRTIDVQTKTIDVLVGEKPDKKMNSN